MCGVHTGIPLSLQTLVPNVVSLELGLYSYSSALFGEGHAVQHVPTKSARKARLPTATLAARGTHRSLVAGADSFYATNNRSE